MKYLRWILLPFSLVYGLVIIIRNYIYDIGILKSHQFDLPVISIGNLDVGGSGKTPMTEYLIRLLKAHYSVATLSRGYGRKTKGYGSVSLQSTAAEVGDEPAQLKHKFPDVSINVCEDRVRGISMIKKNNQVIILDDAYQHRAVKPGLSILLFEYQKLKGINMLLLAGNRRELFSGRKRADILMVTKCPPDTDHQEQQKLISLLKPFPHQQVFFTGIEYLGLETADSGPAGGEMLDNATVFLLTGIAGTQPLLSYLQQHKAQIIQHKYPDHHQFTLKNITKLADEFQACTAKKKIIITTEKDMQRLHEQALHPIITKLPVYVLPIRVCFLNYSGEKFDQLVTHYVREHTAYGGIH